MRVIAAWEGTCAVEVEIIEPRRQMRWMGECFGRNLAEESKYVARNWMVDKNSSNTTSHHQTTREEKNNVDGTY